MIAYLYKDGIGKPFKMADKLDSVVCCHGISRIEIRYDETTERMIVSIGSGKPVLMEPRAAGIWIEVETGR